MPKQKVRSVLALAVLFLPASGRELLWRIEAVDPAGGGTYSGMQVDSSGNVHASYLNEHLHELRYAFWDRQLKRWFTMKVDDSCGGFSSLALDSQQRPHISYTGYTGQLRYARFDGSAWKADAIPLPVKLVEYYTSIALDAQDRPLISYYEVLNRTNPDYVLHLRVVKFNGRFWELSTVDGATGSGKFNAMAMGSNGSVHVAYANVRAESASLRYARWDGDSWRSQTLEGVERPQDAHSVNIAIGKDGVPHITYTLASRLIKYGTMRDGKWRLETVDTVS